jgi:hypothetical protein
MFRGKYTLTHGSNAFAYYLHSLCFLLSTHLASRHLLFLVIFQPRRYLFFSHEWCLVKLLRLLLVNPADEQKRQDQKTAPACLLSTLKLLRGAPNTNFRHLKNACQFLENFRTQSHPWRAPCSSPHLRAIPLCLSVSCQYHKAK